MILIEGEAYGNIYGSSYGRSGAYSDSAMLARELTQLIGANGFPVRSGSQIVLGNAIPIFFGGLRNQFMSKGL